jgi:hypothetical protein
MLINHFLKSNTAGATFGAGTAYHFRAPEFTLCFYWDSCCSIFSFLCSLLWIIVCTYLSFGHCIVLPSLIYGFRLLLWYFQTVIISLFIRSWGINIENLIHIVLKLYLEKHSQLHSKYRIYSVLCGIINDY